MTATSFDVTVIGSGPGGYVAALRASQLGLRTAVVEMAPRPGGTCLHWGCIPTKALLHAAEILESAQHGAAFGVKVSGVELDLEQVQRYKTKTVDANARGVEFLFKRGGVSLLAGRGKIAGTGRVEVQPTQGAAYAVDSTSIVVATGSVIRGLPGVEFDGRAVIHSDHALGLRHVPASLIVLGAGAVGVEFASIYRSFGAQVTLVELLPRLVPIEDAALGAELEKAFVKRGIAVHTSTKVQAVERRENGVRVRAEKNGSALELEAERLLVAVGRRPLTDGLGLEALGARLDARGFVEVDRASMLTAAPGVYAIGDVIATPALAHVASHEGVVAVEHAAGRQPHPIDYDKVPSCTYCSPELASVGLSEEEARRRGHEVRVGTFPFSASGKAKILGDTRGFVKLVVESRYDEVLGVHILGPHATELIAEASTALSLEATAESIFNAIHAHPTLSEAMGEAALAAHGRAIHV
ncbi:MAG TPA: dihydrolipoyl dehydrogenase [Candidatus Polarisedimenticolaceae bacterium]|nr:dihydrolipoyl dehydrogenase [Candidatus Polarisedimenticolaceae bacterium]